jgi:hypothetical protein
MSTPISATMHSAARLPTPVMVSSRSRAAANGASTRSMWPSSSAIEASSCSRWATARRMSSAWWAPKRPRRAWHSFRVRCVRTGDVVECVGAAGSHTARAMGLAALPYPRTARATARARAGPLSRRGPCWASGDVGLDLAVVVGGARTAGPVRPPGRPGTRRLGARIARRSRHSVRALAPICGMAPQVVRSMLAGIRPTMTWAEPVAATIGARRDGPGPRVARSGRSPGLDGARARGPGAAQASSKRRRLDGCDALTCGLGWWAWEDLNLRPHPDQLNAGNRCAEDRFCRSRPTVGAEVKCSHSVQLSALPTRADFLPQRPSSSFPARAWHLPVIRQRWSQDVNSF